MTSCSRQLGLACRIVTDFKGRGIIDDGMECPENEIGGADMQTLYITIAES